MGFFSQGMPVAPSECAGRGSCQNLANVERLMILMQSVVYVMYTLPPKRKQGRNALPRSRVGL